MIICFSFKPEPWGECSVSCGEGIRKRDVPCSIFLDFSQTFARVPDSYCQGPKPATTEPCIEAPCLAGNRQAIKCLHFSKLPIITDLVF